MTDRIKGLCKLRGTSLTKIEAEFGWGNGSVAKWEKAKNGPPKKRLQQLADRLDVSVEYILNGVEENKKSPTPEGMELSNNEILEAYYRADEVTQELIRRALGLQ